MQREQKSNSYLVGAVLIMGYLYYRATFETNFYALPNIIANLLQAQPLSGLFATFTFRYGEQVISMESLGYFGFLGFFGSKIWLFLSYFILAYLWYGGLSGKMRDVVTPIVVALLLSVSYAAADEFHQSLVSPAFAMKEDVILAGAGAILAIITGWLFLTVRKGRK
nr:VanZ family protein [uncultured Trichococcus sp.]